MADAKIEPAINADNQQKIEEEKKDSPPVDQEANNQVAVPEPAQAQAPQSQAQPDLVKEVGWIPAKCWRILPIFDDEDAQKLKQHKYSGSDEGLSYKYCYSPLATRCVDCLPDYVAPNTLTLIGFIHGIVPAILVFSLNGFSLYGKIDSWILFLQAYCFFIYRMLDEMDGKQARKTQNSSPLGLLFDHGCDCYQTGILALLLLRTLQIGNNWLSFLVIVLGVGVFHFTTLEEYYIGTLKLPIFNPVSDGSIVAIALFLITGIIGNEVFVKEAVSATWLGIEGVETLTVGQLAVFVFGIFLLGSLIVNLYTIIRSRSKPWETQSEFVDFRYLFMQIFGYALYVAVWWIFCIVGEDPILQQMIQLNEEVMEAQEVTMDPCGPYAIAALFFFCNMVTHMTIWIQLSHVSRQRYIPFGKLYTFNLIAMIVTIIVAVAIPDQNMDTKTTLLILLVITFITQWVFIIRVIYEITKYLNIRVFRTKQSVERENAAKNSTKLQTPLL